MITLIIGKPNSGRTRKLLEIAKEHEWSANVWLDCENNINQIDIETDYIFDVNDSGNIIDYKDKTGNKFSEYDFDEIFIDGLNYDMFIKNLEFIKTYEANFYISIPKTRSVEKNKKIDELKKYFNYIDLDLIEEEYQEIHIPSLSKKIDEFNDIASKFSNEVDIITKNSKDNFIEWLKHNNK